MQLAAREPLKGPIEIDGQFQDVIPAANEENIITTGIDDMNLPGFFLRRVEQGKFHMILLANAINFATAKRINVMLEKEGELPRQRGHARQCRIAIRESRQEGRPQIIYICTQDTKTRDTAGRRQSRR